MPRFAAVCAITFDKRNVRLSSGHQTNVHYMANRGKIRQSVQSNGYEPYTNIGEEYTLENEGYR